MKKKSNYPLGLDISDLSIKMIQLTQSGKKIEITAAGKVPLEPGVIENGEIKNMRAATEAINSLIAKPQYGSVGTVHTVICLPDAKTFIKLIEIDKTPNDIELMIPAEIEKYVPMSINDICYDWQLIEKKTNSSSVLIGAAPTTTVNQHMELIQETKLIPVAMEIESIAICRALLTEEGLKQNEKIVGLNYCVVDIGFKRSNITIYSHNTIACSVSLPISGGKITEKISEALEIDMEQAEKAKIICGLDQNKANGIISGLLSETVHKLNDRITDVLDFFYKHYPERGKVDKIILCGGGSNINNLKNIISKKTGIPTEDGSIFTNIEAPDKKISDFFTEIHSTEEKNEEQKQSLKQSSSLSYATATGLALRGLQIDI